MSGGWGGGGYILLFNNLSSFFKTQLRHLHTRIVGAAPVTAR